VSLTILALALTAGAARADGRSPNCYLLSAGVDNYPGAGKLNGCLNDARNTTAAFQSQEGLLFGKVHARTLLDQTASRGAILRHFKNFARQGAAGDYMVLFLSGHGGRADGNKTWYFLPHDFDSKKAAATTLTDRQILEAADVPVRQGKKVIVIIDACFCGQLAVTARPYLNRYRNAKGGGLVLLLSSSANQTSAALGNYSAFAKAFVDGMAGPADFNRDGKITLQEIQEYSYQRTHQLLRERNTKEKQDSEVVWSPSVPASLALARTKTDVARRTDEPRPAPPKTRERTVTVWTGKETLPGYGRLTLRLYPGNKVVMIDAKQTSEGEWERFGKLLTLRFDNGRVVYSGVLEGSSLYGTARNERTTWKWLVERQPPAGN
jgi:uncharacterized caspase-like protein